MIFPEFFREIESKGHTDGVRAELMNLMSVSKDKLPTDLSNRKIELGSISEID